MNDLVLTTDTERTIVRDACRGVLDRLAALSLGGVARGAELATDPALLPAFSEEVLAGIDTDLEHAASCSPWPGVRVASVEVRYRGAAGVRVYVCASLTEAGDDTAVPFDTSGLRLMSVGEFENLLGSLRVMCGDCVALAESAADIEDLADQLADSFETLDLLYTLGRQMTDLSHPTTFLQHACESLRTTLGFGYIAVHVPKDSGCAGELAGQTLWTGVPGGSELDGTLDRLVRAMSNLGEISSAFRGPQAVVRPLNSDKGLAGILLAGDKQSEGGNISSYDTKLIDATIGFMSTFMTNSRLFFEQKRLAFSVLESLSAAIDAKDPYTRGHSQRVSWLSEQIARSMGIDEATSERLRIAGLLHDIGKIGVRETVLSKPGRLTEDEFDEIKKHPEIGHKILKDLIGLDDVLPAVLHHHERIDGLGYPSGLAGDQIPLSARIVACADTFDAMSTTRSYREKMPRAKVLEEMRRSAGTQLDPGVVEAFMRLDLAAFDALLDDNRPSEASEQAA
ncbi:MAG: HD-GYP domain-containing protein [Planctomycetota bacterium]